MCVEAVFLRSVPLNVEGISGRRQRFKMYTVYLRCWPEKGKLQSWECYVEWRVK